MPLFHAISYTTPVGFIDKPRPAELDDPRAKKDDDVRVCRVVATMEYRRQLVVLQIQRQGLVLHDRGVDRLAEELPADGFGQSARVRRFGHRIEQSVGTEQVVLLICAVFQLFVHPQDHHRDQQVVIVAIFRLCQCCDEQFQTLTVVFG